MLRTIAFHDIGPLRAIAFFPWFVPKCVTISRSFVRVGKISLTSPIVINVPTRASLAVETKGLLFLWLAHLNNKSNVCKQIPYLQ